MTATATSVVTTGVKRAVRKKLFARASGELRSNAAPSEAPMDSGTPTATK